MAWHENVFLGGAKPPGQGTRCGVVCLGPCWTKFFMEQNAFTKECLSDVRIIVLIMRVPFVE
jgi:hypothetical protein